jgi:hypothetical protein
MIAPSSYIRRHPFKSVGAAVTFGLLIGISGSKKTGQRKESDPVSGTPGISTMIFNELKRLATRKAIEYTSDLIDEKLNTRKKESPSSDL